MERKGEGEGQTEREREGALDATSNVQADKLE